jgi:hypothetical protein
MKKALLTFLLIILLPVFAFAVTTVTYVEGTYTLTISAIATNDWLWTDTFPEKVDGIKVISIRFNPGAASDRCIINAGTTSGADLFDSSVAADSGDGKIQYYDPNVRLKPVLDESDGTYNADAKITIVFGE